jgi:hypothetical protein
MKGSYAVQGKDRFTVCTLERHSDLNDCQIEDPDVGQDAYFEEEVRRLGVVKTKIDRVAGVVVCKKVSPHLLARRGCMRGLGMG